MFKNLRATTCGFFAIVVLASVLLLISTVGKFYPSGDLAVFMSSSGSSNSPRAHQAKSPWKYYHIHRRGRKELGCRDNNVDNTTATGAHISLKHLKPWRFLPEYKNPCWMEKNEYEGNNLRCLPYLFIAGFPKCGTTDLYFRLTQHPYIEPGATKEPHSLTRFMYKAACASKYKYLQASSKCYIQNYVGKYFGYSAEQIKRNKAGNKVRWVKTAGLDQSNKPHQMITVDGSASTAWDNRNWRKIQENRGCPEPVVGPADIVTSINPDVRIVMILRDPTERLYSDYVYFKRGKPPSKEDFHEKAINSVNAFRNCTLLKPLSLCLLEKVDLRLTLGLYHVFISDWMRVLPPSQLLVLHSESYRANVTDSLEKTFQFLQLPPLTKAAMTRIANMKEQNTNKKKSFIGKMLPETESLLRQFYSEHNQRLAEMLKDDRFAWDR